MASAPSGGATHRAKSGSWTTHRRRMSRAPSNPSDRLLDRTQLLPGLGPQPMKEYRLIMTKTQLQQAEWILLGGLPGAVLLTGGLVWLRRRR